MTIEKVYQVLTKVGIDAELKLEAPSGGLIQLRTLPSNNHLQLRCSQESAVWDLFQLTRAIGKPSFSLRNLRRLRSPLVQTVEVWLGDNELLTWAPGKYPKIESLRTLIRLLS